VTLHPVTLGFELPAHRAGRPRVAAPDDGSRILKELATLSRPYGTAIEIGDGPLGPAGYLDLTHANRNPD
jgi:poly-gamma-glutamate synthesis protein (capsule biosynthesis protein)